MASKHKSLSLQDKIKILKVVEESAGQHGSKGRIAKEFGIANSTLPRLILYIIYITYYIDILNVIQQQ